ncbi:hypothetical protein ACLOJK_008325 [Asimina triloba]
MIKYNQFGVLPEHQKSGAPSSPNGSHGGQNPFRSEEPLLLLQLAQISVPAEHINDIDIGKKIPEDAFNRVRKPQQKN